jgi:hypothetical protein
MDEMNAREDDSEKQSKNGERDKKMTDAHNEMQKLVSQINSFSKDGLEPAKTLLAFPRKQQAQTRWQKPMCDKIRKCWNLMIERNDPKTLMSISR